MKEQLNKSKTGWSGRLGFILAATGSAVGLGNLWKFPYIVGENGGGAFVLVYLLFIAMVALPIFFAEFILSQKVKTNIVEVYSQIIGKKSVFDVTGYICQAALLMIMTFYSVVGGWVIYFSYLAFSDSLFLGGQEGIQKILPNLLGDYETQITCFLIFYIATAFVVVSGVQKGIERCSKILMPVLFFMLIAMLFYSSSLDGFVHAFEFLFQWNPEKLTMSGVLEALGHSFFTLSVGFGIVMVYGGYLSDPRKIGTTCASVAILDTFIALVGGIVIFSVVFSFPDVKIQPGPTLIFQTFPLLFNDLGQPYMIVNAFFLLFLFAAFSSSVSILEVPTSYLIQKFGMSRLKAVLGIGLFSIFFGVIHIFSFLPNTPFMIGKFTSFDFFDYVATNILIPTSAFMISVFAGYKLSFDSFEVISNQKWIALSVYWAVRFLCPVAILIVMIKSLF